ncbi:methyltransferase domain-containing protein [Paenibacillus sp. SI8]|uniref:MerR family transcriptional regulator n=1 Tax=unclassified Paenibacillus TaxID=185978 RepID=UPI003465BE91
MASEAFLTTGQIAQRTGMTLRTLRYYDQIGLLSPPKINDTSARRYSKEDLIRLQKIQILKYIGLSLQEIKRVMKEESQSELDLRSSLSVQREVLRHKIAHMEYLLKAIHQAMNMMNGSPKKLDWSHLTDLIHAVNTEKDWVEQYHTATRLQTRIQLYDKFSVNQMGWHRWLFEYLIQLPGCNVLELGCGDGALWSRNLDRIPPNWRITISDISNGMLEEARRNLAGNHSQFKFLFADSQDIPFHDEQFDIVIANNMLYHVPDISKTLSEIHRVLKHGGVFCTSTMSKRHLQEVEEMAQTFDPEIQVLDRVIERFQLDHASEILSHLFSEVELFRYDDYLLVTEVQPLIYYMTSTPMNARERLTGDKLHHFTCYLEALLEREGQLHITKDIGILLGRK